MIDGLILTLIGMSVVVAFLTVLVLSMGLLERLTRGMRERSIPTQARPETLVAVAVAAIETHRRRAAGGAR